MSRPAVEVKYQRDFNYATGDDALSVLRQVRDLLDPPHLDPEPQWLQDAIAILDDCLRSSANPMNASDGVSRMEAERKALIDSLATHCIRCKVPYGEHGCTHPAPTAERLLAAVHRIAAEEERKQRVRNAQHALRYRAEARAAGGVRG